MSRADLDKLGHEELLALAEEQEAALATYKETLGRIYHEFDAKIEELSLIRDVSDVLRQADDLASLALGLVRVVMGESEADYVSLMLTDPEMTAMCPVAHFNRAWDEPRVIEDPSPGSCVPLTDPGLGQSVAEGRVLLMADLAGEMSTRPADLPPDSASLISLPLVARQQILGAIILVSGVHDSFSQEHARFLAILCDHAASALINVRLIDQLGEINERLLVSELEAHQAREYLQRLLDSASDLILIAGPDGRITYANQAVSDFGRLAADLIGMPLPELFKERERAQAMMASDMPAGDELEMEAPGGSLATLVSTTPLQESGEVLIMVRDVTRRKALERQVMHAEKLASVGILAAGVAHEIGNPLSAISGYAQLLDSDDTSSQERKEFAGAIGEQAERIGRIIRELLDYSRPSPHQGRVVEVNQAIEAVLTMFFTAKRVRQSNIDIQRNLARDLPGVSLDRDQLQQVVLNMVINAEQAMAGGGKLTIRTRRENGWVCIEFKDTGPGIPADSLPLIFDPFFTTKPPGQGTGLGLSICDRVVSAAGGSIEVRSKPGRGATFVIRLPEAAENQ